jgi:hypothetical protein
MQKRRGKYAAPLCLCVKITSPFSEHKTPYLEKVLEVDEGHAGPDAVGAEGAKVLAVDHQIRAPAGS